VSFLTQNEHPRIKGGIWIILITALSTIAHGYDLNQHITYNLVPFYQGDIGSSTLSSGTVGSVFSNIVLSDSPFYYMLLAFSARVLGVCLLYKVSRSFGVSPLESIAITFFFTLSSSVVSHGLVYNGLFGPLLAIPATFSGLLSLAALWSFLRGRFVLGIMMLAISCAAHPLYGGSFAFFTFAFFIRIFSKTYGLTVRILVSAICISFVYLLVALFEFPGLTDNVELVRSWHAYATSFEPDDVLMMWSLGEYGYFLVPLFFISGYLIFISRERRPIDHACISALSMVVIALLMETIHAFGLFIPYLSEIFLALQVRRGMWLIVFLCIVKVIHFFTVNGVQTTKFNQSLIFIGLTAIFFFPSWLSACFLYFFVALVSRSKLIKFFFFSFLIAVLLVYLRADQILDRNAVAFVAISGFFALLLVVREYITLVNYRLSSVCARLSAVHFSIIICVTVSVLSGIRYNHPIHSYNNLLQLHRSEAGFYDSLVAFNPRLDIKLKRFLDSYVEDHGRVGVLLPISGQSYWDAAFYHHDMALSRHDFALAIFSSAFFSGLSSKVDDLLGTSSSLVLERGFIKAALFQAIDSSFLSLTCDGLFRLNTIGISLYITNAPRADLTEILVMKTSSFFVYDIGAINCTP